MNAELAGTAMVPSCWRERFAGLSLNRAGKLSNEIPDSLSSFVDSSAE